MTSDLVKGALYYTHLKGVNEAKFTTKQSTSFGLDFTQSGNITWSKFMFPERIDRYI